MKQQYYIENYADIRGDYGTFDSKKEIEEHIRRLGYDIVRITNNTYWINQTPLL